VGATIGVGLFEGRNGVNSSMLVKVIAGWVFTILIVGMSTALVMGPNPEPARPNPYI
jgi:sodium-dependent phosphate transporter